MYVPCHILKFYKLNAVKIDAHIHWYSIEQWQQYNLEQSISIPENHPRTFPASLGSRCPVSAIFISLYYISIHCSVAIISVLMTSLISDADTWTSSLWVSVQQIRQYVAAVCWLQWRQMEHRVVVDTWWLVRSNIVTSSNIESLAISLC